MIEDEQPKIVRGALSATTVVVHAAEDGTTGTRARIAGLLVPFGKEGNPSGPFRRVRIKAGSVALPDQIEHVKLLRDHDTRRPVGRMIEAHADEHGLWGTFEMGRTADAMEAIQQAQDGVVDGLSVGLEVTEAESVPDQEGLWEVTAAHIVETSLVALPAYTSARLTSIAAKRKETPVETDETNTPAPGAPSVSVEQMSEAITAALEARFGDMNPQMPAPRVAPDASAVAERHGLAIDDSGYGITGPAYIGATGRRISAGDYLSAYLRARRDQDATELRSIQAELAHNKTSDVPGLLPTPILGPLLGDVEYIRRVWNSSGALRVMPSKGKGFQRPKITQHVKVDKQALEKTEVASQPMKVTLDDVAKETIAGALNLSVQAIDWTEPALLDLVIRDFARIYAAYSDTYAATALTTGATGTKITADPTKPADVNAALYQAAAAVWSIDDATDPNTLWMSVDVWATLGAMVDTNGRPLFPFLSPSNALGTSQASNPDNTNVQGWRPVVSPKLPAGTLLVGDNRKFELYEDRRGMLRAEEPSILGVQIAWYGYVASYIANGKAFVPIELKAPAPETTASK